MKRLSMVVAVLSLAGAAACARLLPRTAPLGGQNLSRSVVVGEQFGYSVRAGDSLAGIAARFAVSARTLASRNRLPAAAKVVPRQILSVDNRHIVPASLENGILINIPQRLLFFFEDGRLTAWYPVGIGGPGWQTPTGSYKVVTMEEHPTWDVPVSIQREMRRKGERVRKRVPPGPDNPLGDYWLGLSLTCCGIHATNAPQSVYTFQTHGCIRMQTEDAADLFSRVSVGTPVEIIYEPVLIARDDDGAIFLEVHPDVYRRTENDFEKAREVAESRGLHSAWKSPLWHETLRNQEGIAIRLPLRDERFQNEAAAR